MRLARCGLALAGFSIALLAACASSPSALAQGTIWAECVSGSLTQTCQASSWYTGPVAVVWRASPTPENTSPCLLGIEYPFTSDSVSNLSCTANWKTEGTDSRELTLHVEVTTPSGEAVAQRLPDDNGWYNHPVAITFKGKGYSGPASCRASGSAATITYAGPDTLGASVGATCVDPAGKSVTPGFALRYDATPPKITGAFPDRAPGFNGWYNHPVTFAFTGSDALSGMEPCTATYAGPDSEDAELIGTCRDRAGNLATLTVPLHYSATPPALSAAVTPGDGTVSLRWQSSTSVEVLRSPGLHGPHTSMLFEGRTAGTFTDTRPRNGVKYTYTLRAKDRAGNVTNRSLAVTPGPQLLAPAQNARVAGPPLLRWTPVRGVSYYNVQLYRGRKLLSTWPVHASLQLGRVWRFAGNEYRLAPGRYSWYVWPGFGTFGAAHYGRLIGHRTFILQSPASG